MQISENTILITGGGSGIGRGLAEAFHAKGNKVIIAGRRKTVLDEVVAANKGMAAVELNIDDGEAVKTFAKHITSAFPELNVVINNAGIMRPETISSAPDYLETAEATISTNVLGPIRMTAALLPSLMKQKAASVINVTSGLAFVPLAHTPTYSASKFALHAYSEALRHQLRQSSVQVIELAPPYVQTELMTKEQASDPNAMPLKDFITEVMSILENNKDVEEVIVERCKPLRNAARDGNYDKVFAMLNSRFS